MRVAGGSHTRGESKSESKSELESVIYKKNSYTLKIIYTDDLRKFNMGQPRPTEPKYFCGDTS